jgi:hypothetical protein
MAFLHGAQVAAMEVIQNILRNGLEIINTVQVVVDTNVQCKLYFLKNKV